MDPLITDEMLDAAVKKAVEAGLLPRHAGRQDNQGYQELIRYVLEAALEAAPSTAMRRPVAQPVRSAIRGRLAEVRDMTHWLQGCAQN